MANIETKKSSAAKSLEWRIIGVFWLAMITYIFTRNWIAVSTITFIHHGLFLFIFYAHERAWLRSKIALKYMAAIKAITYEIIIANIVLGTITYLITGCGKTMTAITLTYTLSKLLLYYVYDRAWAKYIAR